ncbi:hypothetical protein RB195_023024 [Necator americanus]|uniref:Reverse transcriptase domain-containing protein n=1 Tax=Necator americanus TaxID=51031 RepID=A0ABR1EJR2_NECAM
MCKVLERIILDRLIKHRGETECDEQAGFRLGRSTIDQVFIVRRVIKIWERYSKPMQLAFLDVEAAFDSPHQGRLLNALRADGVPGKFVGLLDDKNQRCSSNTSRIYNTIRVGNWRKTRSIGRTLPVQLRYRRHYAKNSRSVSSRYRFNTCRHAMQANVDLFETLKWN